MKVGLCTYNGYSIRALGLTKAVHLYWQAQWYEDPLSSFEDHANALEYVCSMLTNQPLYDPITGQLTGLEITRSDCDEVREAIEAVELRTPSPCTAQ